MLGAATFLLVQTCVAALPASLVKTLIDGLRVATNPNVPSREHAQMEGERDGTNKTPSVGLAVID